MSTNKKHSTIIEERNDDDEDAGVAEATDSAIDNYSPSKLQ